MCSASEAQSVAPSKSAASASASTRARKALGGLHGDELARAASVSTTRPPATRLTVSTIGTPGMTASAPAASPASTRSITPLVTSGRAASCTSTKAGARRHGNEPLRHGPARASLRLRRPQRPCRRAGRPRRASRDPRSPAGRRRRCRRCPVVVEDRQRGGQQRAPAKAHERLRAIGAEAVAGAGADEDRPGLAGHGHLG